MCQSGTLGKRTPLLAVLGLCALLIANLSTAHAADSSCVTCHLDQEMLKKTVTIKKKAKSAMQSGAG